MTTYNQASGDLLKMIEESFKETVLIYSAETTRVISDTNAFTSHLNRDIVDTGRLRASQQINFTSPLEADLSWNTEYALYVNQGYVAKNGNVVVGRPWHELAANRIDLQSTFDRILTRKLRG